MESTTSNREARIRNFGVGLLAIATLAVAGYVLRRRRTAMALLTTRDESVDDLYAAGL